MWVFVLKSGVHATLAGVMIAFTVPMKREDGDHSLLHHLEHALHPWVAYMILPIFAFANAGVTLTGLTWADFAQPLTLGIAAGLFIGKQIGVMGATVLAVKTGFARLATGCHLEAYLWHCCADGGGFYHEPFHWISGLWCG